MPFRETISLILHDVQANGKGALTLEDTPVDPRLTTFSPLSSTSRSSSAPPKTPYNRSRKRKITEITDDEDGPTNALKKVNLRVAITSLLREIARNRY